jgi:predicted lipase
VHQGFYNAFAGVEGYIRTEVQKLVALYRSAKIHMTGYSLGSALATIAALDLQVLFGNVNQIYTFGEPRVGN